MPKLRTIEAALTPVLAGKRPWPAVPAIDSESLAALARVVEALRTRALSQGRETGNIADSLVTIADLVSLGLMDSAGKLLEKRVEAIEERLEAAGIP